MKHLSEDSYEDPTVKSSEKQTENTTNPSTKPSIKTSIKTTIRPIFKNQDGQVRWGYKLLTFAALWQVVFPVIILCTVLVLMLVLKSILTGMGMMDSGGNLPEVYWEPFQRWYMVVMMCLQNLIMIFLSSAVWKWGFHSSWKKIGIFGSRYGVKWLAEIGKGILIGIVMISLVVGGIWITGNASLTVGSTGFDPWLAGYFIMFIAVGFGEEICYRGYAMASMRTARPSWLILVLPAILFGAAHGLNSNFSLLAFINICLVGVFLGLLFWYTDRIWIPIGFHIAWNYFQGPVYGFEVSGIDTPRIFIARIGEPNLLNGGGFGPEGGLFTTAVLVLAIGCVLYYYKGIKPKFMEAEESAQP